MLFLLRVGAISNRPKHCFFHFLGFGRLKIAPTVREIYSEGKLLIFIAYWAGDWKSPLLFARKATEEFDYADYSDSYDPPYG